MNQYYCQWHGSYVANNSILNCPSCKITSEISLSNNSSPISGGFHQGQLTSLTAQQIELLTQEIIKFNELLKEFMEKL